MKRRDFLKLLGIGAAIAQLPTLQAAQPKIIGIDMGREPSYTVLHSDVLDAHIRQIQESCRSYLADDCRPVGPISDEGITYGPDNLITYVGEPVIWSKTAKG